MALAIALQVVTEMVVAVAMGLALAHALELPGKMRLPKDTYHAMQGVYYPGFTFGGIAVPVGIALTIWLLVLTPSDTPAFWHTLAARSPSQASSRWSSRPPRPDPIERSPENAWPAGARGGRASESAASGS